MEAEGGDGWLGPVPLTAGMVNVDGVPLASPVTMPSVAVAGSLAVVTAVPPELAVITYPVRLLAPVSGGSQETSAAESRAVTPVMTGGSGEAGAAGVT